LGDVLVLGRKVGRGFGRPAAAAAVGVCWAFAETIIVRRGVGSGFYYTESFGREFAGSSVFYILLTLCLWLGLWPAAAGWAWFRRGRAAAFADGPRRAALAAVAALALGANLSFAASCVAFRGGAIPFSRRPLLLLVLIIGVFAAVVLAGLLAAAMRRRRPLFRKLCYYTTRGVVAAALTGVLVLHGYYLRGRLRRPSPASPADVVVITLDGWRADAFNNRLAPRIYGFGRDHCRVFTGARTVSPWTMPAFAAAFTGRYEITDANGLEYADSRFPTWAEVMRGAGYDTYMLTANPYLDRYRYLLRGFDNFYYAHFSPFLRAVHFYDTAIYYSFRGADVSPSSPGVTAKRLTARTLEILRAPARRPRFIWVHYLDPHWPYNPEPAVLADVAPGTVALAAGRGMKVFKPENADTLRAMYGAEVKGVDALVGGILDELAARDEYAVIISADHGDEFLDHGRWQHFKTLYHEVTRVPLLAGARVNGEVVPAGEVGTPVSLIDVAPSALAFLGLKIPETMEGRADLLEAGPLADTGPRFMVLNRRRYFLAAAFTADAKVILASDDSGRPAEYYDLTSDPDELTPRRFDRRAEELRRAVIKRFRAELRTHGAGGTPRGDIGGREDLRSLGYLD
jgi:arylsulfatase A-like enzyme